jgi:hypothetical protein
MRCRDVAGFGLQGLTLTRGANPAISCENSGIEIACCLLTYNAGMGGVISAVGSSLTIDRCRVSGNEADGEYSDTPIYLLWSDASISASTISGNAGGGVSAFNSSLVMRNCSLEDNTRGPTLWCEEVPEAWISDCVIRGNAPDNPWRVWSCVDNYESTMHLARCVIAENSAHYGAIGYGADEGYVSMTIEDSLMRDNLSAYGGPIMRRVGGGFFPIMRTSGLHSAPGRDHQLSLKRCTIVGNRAWEDHADDLVIIGYESDVALEDSITAGNDGRLFQPREHGQLVRNCCLQEEFEGEGNFVADPLFVSGPLGDYYLSSIGAGQEADSPCIDAGSTSASIAGVGNLTTRTDGAFDTGIVDIGYHYSATPPTIQASVANLTSPSVPPIPHFAPGETLSASIRIENGGLPLWVDIYAAFILPNGTLFCIAPDGLTGDFVAWSTACLLPTDFVSGDIVVFEVQLPDGLPAGAYAFAAALSLTGEFRPIGDIAFSQFAVGS